MFVRLLTVLLFAATLYLAPTVVRSSLTIQQNKSDLGELNHIYYGIFNVNAWKGQVAQIIFSEINRLDIKSTVKELKSTVENQLTVIIDKLNERIREANKSSFGGKIKQLLINLVVDIEEVKKGVPTYADALITEITKPETEKQVKELATKQLKSYFAKTFRKEKDVYRDAIVERNHATDIDSAKEKLAVEIQERTIQIRKELGALIGLSILMFLIVAITKTRSALCFTLLSLNLLLLMVIGVATPMIDLEAKISEMSFYLLGHKIVFENQILYFQSKSVFDVFMLMITHPDLLMKFVGILMITFSVIIPAIKLVTSMLYYFNVLDARQSKIIDFFAFKTGKWSMADVMVVAIFMAYIGFSGIVSNQFGKMKAMVPTDIVFITTNGTALQPGFFAFFAYAILALLFTTMLKRSTNAQL